MTEDLAAITLMQRIPHHFSRADVEAALIFQVDEAGANAIAGSLFDEREGGFVIEVGGNYPFLGLLLAAIAQSSPRHQLLVDEFLRDVAQDARCTAEYLEGRRRLAANNGERF